MASKEAVDPQQDSTQPQVPPRSPRRPSHASLREQAAQQTEASNNFHITPDRDNIGLAVSGGAHDSASANLRRSRSFPNPPPAQLHRGPSAKKNESHSRGSPDSQKTLHDNSQSEKTSQNDGLARSRSDPAQRNGPPKFHNPFPHQKADPHHQHDNPKHNTKDGLHVDGLPYEHDNAHADVQATKPVPKFFEKPDTKDGHYENEKFPDLFNNIHEKVHEERQTELNKIKGNKDNEKAGHYANVATKHGKDPESDLEKGEQPMNVGPQHLHDKKHEKKTNQHERNKQAYPGPGQHFVHHGRKEKRRMTLTDEVPVEERVPNKYLFRRPRALQVEHNGHVLNVGDEGVVDMEHPESHYSSVAPLSGASSGIDQHHRHESLKKHRERLDLFIDLVFVGTISAIAEHFFQEAFVDEVSQGAAFGHFILLYLPAWRIWATLQNFLNSYFMDDIAQRLLVVWVLILAMVWGNNAKYFVTNIDSGSNGSQFLILAYVLAIVAMAVMEAFYSIWIPWLRRMFLAVVIVAVPSITLWLCATIINDRDKKIWFLSAAIIYDSFQNIFAMSPITDRLASEGDLRKSNDVAHTSSRYENFFIIALGEGVFLLIRGSPLGQGINEHFGRGIQALLIYFYLAFTYFHGDQSKTYIHALYRRWWIKYIWYTIHVPLYAALIMLSSGILYLVEFEMEQNVESTEPEGSGEKLMRRADAGPTPKYTSHVLHVATITVCLDLAVILFCQLVIGLLNRSLDSRHELMIGNKYVRMAPRILSIVTLSCVWIPYYHSPTKILGIILIIVFIVSIWEFAGGFERHAQLFEPIHAWGLSKKVKRRRHKKH